jgi:hypothetical protein
LYTTDSPTAVGADRARSSAENLQPLAHTQLTWLIRVPAPLSAAPSGLAQVEPQARMPLTQGYRTLVLTSRSGGIEPHEEHQHLLRLLSKPDMRFSDVKYS